MSGETQATAETTTETTAETTATGAAAELAGTNAPEWASGFSEENQSWLATKGLAGPEQVVNSYRNLEKLFGAEKAGNTFTIPENGDASAWDAIYDKMGRPESAAAYELGDDPFASAMGEAFHKAGLSPDRAAMIKEAADAFTAEAEAAKIKEWNAQSQAEHNEWKQELGAKGYDAALKAYRAATVEFDLSPQKVQAIEEALGTKQALQLISAIGAKIGEDTLPDPNRISQIKQEAGEKIAALKSDRAFRQKFADGDTQALELWNRLHEQQHQADPKAYARSNFLNDVPGL